MRAVWKLINSINKKCDLEDKSIFACLQELSIPVEKFLALFNVNPEIIDELFIRQLLNLLKNKSTRIFMDPSLDKDSEIEIFSKELNISISILENTLKIIWGETKEDETFEYYSTEFYAITKDGEIKTIHFASDVIKEKSFPDHYQYREKDIIKLKDEAIRLNAILVTTEKDKVKLSSFDKGDIISVPVNISWQDEAKILDFLISHD